MSAFARSLMSSSRTMPVPQAVAGSRRTCGCGTHNASCAKCNSKPDSRRSWSAPRQSRFVADHESAPAPVVVAAAGARDARSSTAHDFTRLPLNAREVSLNGGEDDEGLESTNIPVPSTSGLNAGGAAGNTRAPSKPPMRPAGTRVDAVSDFTQVGLQAGYRSGYGSVVRIKVLPDEVTWDGDSVKEELWQLSNTCPATLTTPGPCHGDSTFPIGSPSGRSSVVPPQPAMRNRFYDYHVTRSRDVSFLHDATRNPAGINACEAVCRQNYAHKGIVIGSHIITRRFRKGVVGGRDVTIVDVTKSDLPQGPGDFPGRELPPDEAYASAATPSEPTTGQAS